MREYKFRGKCILEGEFKGKWVYGDLLQKNGETYITPNANAVHVNGHVGKLIMHEVDPETVGQYTGLRDKKGKKIYEGDIVSHPQYGILTVVWDEDECGFFFKSKRGTLYLAQIQVDLEVIGNVFENPELLERT